MPYSTDLSTYRICGRSVLLWVRCEWGCRQVTVPARLSISGRYLIPNSAGIVVTLNGIAMD